MSSDRTLGILPAKDIFSTVVTTVITTLLCTGFALMYGSAFELNFNAFLVFLVSLLQALVFALINRSGKKISTAVLAAVPVLTILLICFNAFHFRDGLTEFITFAKINNFYWIPGEFPEPVDGGTYVFLFIGAYNVIASCVTAYLLTNRKLIPVSLVFFVPFFACSVSNTYLEPDTLPCLIAATGLLMTVFAHLFRARKERVSSITQLILAVPTILFLVILGVIFPHKNYNKNEVAENILISLESATEKTAAKNKFVNKIISIAVNGVNNPYKSTGGDQLNRLYPANTYLEQVGPFHPEIKPVMEIEMVKNGDYHGNDLKINNTIYLKIESLDTYEDNVLSNSRIGHAPFIHNYEQQNAVAPYYVTVTPIVSTSLDATPYYSDFYCTGDIENPIVNPYNSSNNKTQTFAGAFAPLKTNDIYSGDYVKGYAYSTAVKVPLETKQAILDSGVLPSWYIDAYNGNSNMTDAEKVRKVTEFVRNLHPYDADTPIPPNKVDFVPWFLTEAESGICVHYAVTTVVLLRMLGIPARYVHGYVDTGVHLNRKETITSTQSHAWFEFFVPDYGWIMGDSTPGYENYQKSSNIDAASKAYPEIETAVFSLGNLSKTDSFQYWSQYHYTEATGETSLEVTDTPTPSPSPTPSPLEADNTSADSETSASESSSETSSDVNETDPSTESSVESTAATSVPESTSAPASSGQDNSESDMDRQERETKEFFTKVAIVLLITLAILLLLLTLIKIIVVTYWNSRFKCNNNSEKAVAYYHYFKYIMFLLKIRMPDKASHIARKAVFAEHDLSQNELDALLSVCTRHIEDISHDFRNFKKLLFKLMSVKIHNQRT